MKIYAISTEEGWNHFASDSNVVNSEIERFKEQFPNTEFWSEEITVVTPINYVYGDATDPSYIFEGEPLEKELRVIPHICNDIGAWGAGFVLALSKKWKAPEADYKNWFSENKPEGWKDQTHKNPVLGATRFVRVEKDIIIANIIGQSNIRKNEFDKPPVRYDAIIDGLSIVRAFCIGKRDLSGLNVSVHMPKIAAGLAGGNWAIIEQIIIQELCNYGISVIVYEFDQL